MKISNDFINHLVFKPIDDYAKSVQQWHRFFPIIPVVIDGDYVFFQLIERRRVEKSYLRDGIVCSRVVTEYRYIEE